MELPKTQADLDAIAQVMREYPDYTERKAWNAVQRGRRSDADNKAVRDIGELSAAFRVGHRRGNYGLAQAALEEIKRDLYTQLHQGLLAILV